MKEPLEKRLESLRELRMAPDVEARVRRRLAEARQHPRAAGWQRYVWRGSYAQLALLLILLAAAGWVIAKQVYPVLASAWERYCAPHESSQTKRAP